MAATPSPPSPRPPRGPWILFGGLLVAAIAVVVAIPLLVPTVGFGIAVHEVCGTGAEVESQEFWTPVVLLNSPYGGQAWGNGTGPGLVPIVNAVNGEARAAVEPLTWHLYRLVNTSAAGPGLSSPCSAGYAATSTSTGDISEVQLLPIGSTTDFGEATSFTYEGIPSVLFTPTSYSSSSGGMQIDNCPARVAVEENTTSAVYPITIPFTVAGTSHPVRVLFPASVRYTYEFPLGGEWDVYFAGTDPQGQSDGGWTFTWQSCTTVRPPG